MGTVKETVTTDNIISVNMQGDELLHSPCNSTGDLREVNCYKDSGASVAHQTSFDVQQRSIQKSQKAGVPRHTVYQDKKKCTIQFSQEIQKAVSSPVSVINGITLTCIPKHQIKGETHLKKQNVRGEPITGASHTKLTSKGLSAELDLSHELTNNDHCDPNGDTEVDCDLTDGLQRTHSQFIDQRDLSNQASGRYMGQEVDNRANRRIQGRQDDDLKVDNEQELRHGTNEASDYIVLEIDLQELINNEYIASQCTKMMLESRFTKDEICKNKRKQIIRNLQSPKLRDFSEGDSGPPQAKSKNLARLYISGEGNLSDSAVHLIGHVKKTRHVCGTRVFSEATNRPNLGARVTPQKQKPEEMAKHHPPKEDTVSSKHPAQVYELDVEQFESLDRFVEMDILESDSGSESFLSDCL